MIGPPSGRVVNVNAVSVAMADERALSSAGTSRKDRTTACIVELVDASASTRADEGLFASKRHPSFSHCLSL